MYKIDFTPNFEKQYLKLIKYNPKLEVTIDKVFELLERDPFYPGLRSHIVDKDHMYGNIWSSRVTGDIRILWALDPNQNLVLILLKIGGHDFVY